MADAGDTRALYESFETPFLQELAQAFRADLALMKKPLGRAFVESRLALIAEVLAARGVVVPAHTEA